MRYTTLISDGDAKTHAHLSEEDLQWSTHRKQDCVGHVQKRMGSRLRKKKKERYYSKEKKKVIGLGGKGRLTEAVTDSLQKLLWKLNDGRVLPFNVKTAITLQYTSD